MTNFKNQDAVVVKVIVIKMSVSFLIFIITSSAVSFETKIAKTQAKKRQQRQQVCK